MAYSIAWNEAIPAGTSFANQLDTFITNDKIAVRERLDDIFGTSGGTGWATADPYRPALIRLNGAVASKIIPGSTSLSLRNNADSASNVEILDNGNTSVRGTLAVEKSAKGARISTGSATLDLSAGNSFLITVSGVTSVVLNNPIAGTCYVLEINFTTTDNITFPASVKWSDGITPTFTRTAGRTDIVSLYYNGSVYFATLGGFNYTP